MQEKLSQFHVTILLFITQSGMVIFSLPRLLAEHFGTNGWIAIVLLSLTASLNILLIAAVYHLGKGKSIFEIMEQSLPKFILFPFYLALAILWALNGCLVAKHYILVFQMIAFPTANPMLFKLVFDVLLFTLIIQSIYNIAKAATAFFWMIIWMLLLLIYFFPDFEWSRLTPFIFQDSTITLMGFANVFAAFSGYELYILLFPYVNKQTKLIKSALLGNVLATFNYLLVSFVAFGFYGHIYLKNLQLPLLSMFAFIQFPFVQGTEILFYAFFMFSIIITSGMYLWAAKEVSGRVFPFNQKLLAAGILLFSLSISYFPKVMSELEEWLKYLGYGGLCVAILLPAGLLFLLLIQRMRGETGD